MHFYLFAWQSIFACDIHFACDAMDNAWLLKFSDFHREFEFICKNALAPLIRSQWLRIWPEAGYPLQASSGYPA
jgi:hypothetical protein